MENLQEIDPIHVMMAQAKKSRHRHLSRKKKLAKKAKKQAKKIKKGKAKPSSTLKNIMKCVDPLPPLREKKNSPPPQPPADEEPRPTGDSGTEQRSE